jgi:hypothetical protein
MQLGVGARDPGQLRVLPLGQVLRVLPQREPAPLSALALALASRGGASAGGRPRPRLGSVLRASLRDSFHDCRCTHPGPR